MTTSTTDNRIRLTGRNLLALGAVGFLFFGTLLCFCSLVPSVLFMSFLFNALFLGSSLFSALAQEREKQTIDALRLTQLSSLDILLYKSYAEMKLWRRFNSFFVVALLVSAWWAGSPLIWALVGAATMAASGLLSISLALAVSTRSETTSSAVVNGWICKGVWLVGLPILDYVLEAVLVLSRDLHFFSYLDPAWTLREFVNATVFETSGWSIVWMAVGALVTTVLARLMMVWSARLIDSSFESVATLEDRDRHSVYGKRFALGLDGNPFMVRELAWQIRTGAGAWPGYAVFVTLFLAPFLYGMAQQGKPQTVQPIKVVRHSVTGFRAESPHHDTHDIGKDLTHHRSHQVGSVSEDFVAERCHSGLCLSRFLGLPVATAQRQFTDSRNRLVVRADGGVTRTFDSEVERLKESEKESSRPRVFDGSSRRLATELDRGLLTGLVLTILYLFIRGGAFMSGAVTSERERRAWDQIALTGVAPETYLNGKLLGVLYYPMRQLLLTAPLLLLFAVVGGVSVVELLLVVPLLVASFVAAASLGLVASTSEKTSHQAQGQALLSVVTVMLAPMITGGWIIAGLVALKVLQKTSLLSAQKFMTSTAVAFWVFVWGAAASPLAAVMNVCHFDGLGPLDATSVLPAAAGLVASALSMSLLALMAHRLAVTNLVEGGSVKA